MVVVDSEKATDIGKISVLQTERMYYNVMTVKIIIKVLVKLNTFFSNCYKNIDECNLIKTSLAHRNCG